jgi:hypothetical protein
MPFIFIVVLRARKRLTPKDVAGVKGLKINDNTKTEMALMLKSTFGYFFVDNDCCLSLTWFLMYAASCVVFIPGAAHISSTTLPAGGASRWTAIVVA